jgi:predicted GNAT family acetyltransferase
MLLLGNLTIGYEGRDTHGWRNPDKWVMGTVTDGEEIKLIALMTPPFGITLFATVQSNEALSTLIDGLVTENIYIPNIVAEKNLAQSFSDLYTKAANKTSEIKCEQRIYDLAKVSSDVLNVGKLRPAEEKDLSFLPYWFEVFTHEAIGSPLTISNKMEDYRYHIASGNLYVLEEKGLAVSMVKITRETPTTCCLGYVYTPPYLRKKGYASASVATLSRLMLGRGFQKCGLYTDLANPTSNAIYQNIGYKVVCDSLEIRFV